MSCKLTLAAAASIAWLTSLKAMEPTNSVDDLVTAAVQAEEVGNISMRREMLERVSVQGASDSALWLMGNIRSDDGRWTSLEEAISSAKQNAPLANYLKRRSSSQDNVSGHLEMASYCEHARLADQMRAHLARVISLEPDHAYARQKLGHRRIGFDWITPDQVAYFEQMTELAQTSKRKYGRSLAKIFRDLEGSQLTERRKAEQRLFEMRGDDVIAALEGELVGKGDDIILIGLRWLDEQGSPMAIQSLSRFGIFHPSEIVRRVAGRYLSPRDIYEYAPQLMDTVKAPVTSLLIPLTRENGLQRGFRQVFSQEGAEQQKSLIVDNVVNPRWRDSVQVRVGRNDDLGEAFLRSAVEISNENQIAYRQAILRSANQQVWISSAVDRQNRLFQLVNQRVASLLSQTTGTNVSAKPQELWDWWYGYNESQRPRLRPTSYVRFVNEVSYPVRAVTLDTRQSHECFVKGTPVMTKLGLRPIDEIRPGDIVLSKSIRTGELTWKPVLHTTIRSPSPTLEIRAGKTPLRCTHAHVFWVSGKGWQRASQVREGDVLHCAIEPVVVERLQEAPDCETYNLVVADHANYFVGEQLALTHDVTSRSFAPESVPGRLREPLAL
jgi:hypothetical protein